MSEKTCKMKLSRLGKLFFLILGYVFLIAACKATPTPESPLADRSFITDQPCAAPCWYGLEIGKSTEEDIYKVIKQLPFVDQTDIREFQTNYGDITDLKNIGFRCVYKPEAGFCGGLTVYKGKLAGIGTTIDYKLTIGQVANKLGRPSHIKRFTVGVEILRCDTTIYWEDKSIAVYYSEKWDSCPSAKTKINRDCSRVTEKAGFEGGLPPKTGSFEPIPCRLATVSINPDILVSGISYFSSEIEKCISCVTWVGFTK
jgi:hypothetical protein